MTSYTTHFKTNAEIITELGQKVRRLRLLRNLPQEELARQAGVALGSLKQLERGGDVRLSSLIAILRATGELSGLLDWMPLEDPSPLELMDVGHARNKARRFNRKLSE